jgi:hypothetical protein
MRAKQKRGGSLGQGSRFYYLGANKMPISRVAGAQGFGKTNPSIGSMKSLGIMKQNRKAGGNNVCKETQSTSYYTSSSMKILSNNSIPKGTLIYKNGSTALLGKVVEISSGGNVTVQTEILVSSGKRHIAVTLVTPGQGFPGVPGTITEIIEPKKVAVSSQSSCGCNGPKSYCSNCSGRANVFNAITGGGSFSSTNSFTLLSH